MRHTTPFRFLLTIALLVITACASAQSVSLPDCDYTDAPPTWVQVTKCTTVAKDRPFATDIVIEGLDTTRIRLVLSPITAKYMTIQQTYIPANNQCVLVTVQKKVRCMP